MDWDFSCSGTFDIRLYAAYGSAKGTVIYALPPEPQHPGHEAVKQGWVVAESVIPLPFRYRYTTRTDDSGHFTFTRTSASELQGTWQFPATPINPANNWGLNVGITPEGPGFNLYRIVGGPEQCDPNTSRQAQLVSITSSPLTRVRLRSAGAGCDGCSLTVITPLTEPDSLALEADPLDRTLLAPEMQAALAALEQQVRAAGGRFTLTAAFRTRQYQDHPVTVWHAHAGIPQLTPDEVPACQEEIDNADREWLHHQFVSHPATNRSNHELGRAFDASIRGLDEPEIDALAQASGLWRPAPADYVHFELLP